MVWVAFSRAEAGEFWRRQLENPLGEGGKEEGND